MAGHVISLYLKEAGHDVTGFARSRSAFIDTIIGDALDTDSLRRTITGNEFDVVVNCIGILNQFAETNRDAAAFLNGYLPHLLAKITSDMPTRIIHMSTDCVFSGKRGQYTEQDFPDGTTFYDRSKALGELNDTKNLTLRNSIVGPDINRNGIGLLNWFMQQTGSVKGFAKSIWTGQTTLQLAKTIEQAAKARATGLIHAVPEESVSKYDLLVLFNRHLRNGSLRIEKVDGLNADKSLKRTNFDFPYKIPDYERMITELAEWISVHRTMYPHYSI